MSTVRSVTVRMNADIAKYVSDMRLAGRETDKAFGALGAKLDVTNTRLTTIDNNTRSMATAMRDGSVQVRSLDADVRTLGNDLRRGGSELDRFSGRARILLDVITLLGPGALAIGAVGVPAVAGLASQLGFATLAAGGAVFAFQGVGDALSAIEKYRLDPTVENLEAAQRAVNTLGPDAQRLVGHLADLRDEWVGLRDAAAGGFLPGVDRALTSLETRLPELERVLSAVTDAAGDAVASGAQSLASDRWDDFFDFLATDARDNIDAIADTVGNLAHTGAELWMAFSPLQRDFNGWLRDASESVDDWASRLDQTEGFKDFIDYVRVNGPRVAETVGDLSEALVDIVQAAAPLGGPVLEGVELLADSLSLIADSDAGTTLIAAAGGLALFNRAAAAGTAVAGLPLLQRNVVAPMREIRAQAPSLGQVGTYFRYWGQDAKYASAQTMLARDAVYGFGRTTLPTLAKGAAVGGGLALTMTDVSDGMGLTNAASLALMGTVAGPWGAAIGGGIGLALDFAAANDQMAVSAQDTADIIASGSAKLIAQRRRELLERNREITDNPWKLWKSLPAVFSDSLRKTEKEIRDLGAARDRVFFDRAAARDAAQLGGALEDSLLGPLGKSADGFRIAALNAKDFSLEVQGLLGILSDRASWRAFQAAIDDARAGLNENGPSLDRGTEVGRANEAALDNLAMTALRAAETLKGVRRAAFLGDARKEFVDLADDMGMAIPKAEKLADRLGLLDTSDPKVTVDADTDRAEKGLSRVERRANTLGWMVPRPTVELESEAAEQDIDRVTDDLRWLNNMPIGPRVQLETGGFFATIAAVGRELQAIDGVVANTYVRTIRTGASVQTPGFGPSARGNLFPTVTAYAGGGIDAPNRHLPELYRGRTTRVWGEPETGGEAYIPLANDSRRARAESILEQVAFRFGGTYRSGGRIAAETAAAAAGRRGGSSALTVTGILNTPWGPAAIEGIARDVVRRELDADAAFDDMIGVRR